MTSPREAPEQAVSLLATLDELPVPDHVGVFDRVHRELQDRLASLDDDHA